MPRESQGGSKCSSAALTPDALKPARNLRLHFICFHCEMPPPQITSDNLTYMSRPRRHVKLHFHCGLCQWRGSSLFDNCSLNMRDRAEPLPETQITCGREHEHVFQGTDPNRLLSATSPTLWKEFPSRWGWTLLAGCKHAQTQVLLSGNFYLHCPCNQSN